MQDGGLQGDLSNRLDRTNGYPNRSTAVGNAITEFLNGLGFVKSG